MLLSAPTRFCSPSAVLKSDKDINCTHATDTVKEIKSSYHHYASALLQSLVVECESSAIVRLPQVYADLVSEVRH